MIIFLCAQLHIIILYTMTLVLAGFEDLNILMAGLGLNRWNNIREEMGEAVKGDKAKLFQFFCRTEKYNSKR